MSRTAIVAISRRGTALARTLAASLSGDKTLFLDRRFLDPGDDAVPFDLPARPLVQQVFGEYQRLVLFMPVGAAVRLLAPRLEHKHADPAVVCVDDAGRFAVSLLSGHLGGADQLAEEVANVLGGTSVVTSASHATGSLAVDMLGHEFGWRLDATPVAVTRASAALVNGEQVGVYQEAGEPGWWPEDRPLPENIQVYSSLEALASAPCAAALVITDRLAPEPGNRQSYFATLGDKIVVLYRPRSLVVGLGCRRGVPAEELRALLETTFRQNNLAQDSIRCVATAELKRDEAGINLLADNLGVPVHFYSNDELNSVFATGLAEPEQSADEAGSGPTPSAAPHRLLGLWGVSEPAALLSAGTRKLVVTKAKTTRATIAVARMSFGSAGGFGNHRDTGP